MQNKKLSGKGKGNDHTKGELNNIGISYQEKLIKSK